MAWLWALLGPALALAACNKDGWLGPNARGCDGALFVPFNKDSKPAPCRRIRGVCACGEPPHIATAAERAAACAMQVKAECYIERYEDLKRNFCSGTPQQCDVEAARDHWQMHGKREGRSFGCDTLAQSQKKSSRCETHPSLPNGAAPAAAPAPAMANTTLAKVCVLVRTYDGHAAKIQAALETLLASVQARAGLTLEAHVLNTDPRPFSGCFQRGVQAARAKGQDGGHFLHEGHYQDPKPWWKAGPEYGYVATDLALLKLRKRGGCDYVLVTNGDNIFHVDFFRRVLAEFDANPAAAAVAVDFWCHGQRRWKFAKFRVGDLDLSAALYKASYLDSKNATFLIGAPPPPRRWMSARAFVADGLLAERVFNDLGPQRARVVHDRLVYHL